LQYLSTVNQYHVSTSDSTSLHHYFDISFSYSTIATTPSSFISPATVYDTTSISLPVTT